MAGSGAKQEDGPAFPELSITGLACVLLVGVIIITQTKSSAPPKIAAHRPEPSGPRMPARTEQPRPIASADLPVDPTVAEPRIESSAPLPELQPSPAASAGLGIETYAKPETPHRTPDKTSPPDGSSLASQEDERVEVPGKVLKELVPGYETRRIQGFTMLLSTQVIKEAEKEKANPYRALIAEFDGLAEVLPPGTLKLLHRVLIWVEWDNIDRRNPNVLAKYYGGSVWRVNPSDHPLKSNAIELLSLKKLTEEKSLSVERTRLVLLHELAHAVHHVVVGIENRDVLFAYKLAMDRRLYDNVQTERGGLERAYAATNAREYFAELTCAYLDRCYYFPFTRADLKEHDPTGFRVMERVWKDAGTRKGHETAGKAKGTEPEVQIKGIIERDIRNDTPNDSLRIEYWHPPAKATDGQKDGLLYRVEFSVAVANLREAKMERRNSSYYLFTVGKKVVAKQITPAGWEAVKICKILEEP